MCSADILLVKFEKSVKVGKNLVKGVLPKVILKGLDLEQRDGSVVGDRTVTHSVLLYLTYIFTEATHRCLRDSNAGLV